MPIFTMGIASLIGAGAGIAGDIMSSNAQDATNQLSAQEAQMNRDFQQNQMWQAQAWETNMSNTAMQRRVADLRMAGLNPMMALSQGGASQPSISPGSGSMPSFGNPGQAYGNLGNQVANATQTASTIALQQKQADNTVANTELQNAQAAKTTSETTGSLAQAYLTKNAADVANIQATTQATQMQAIQIDATIKNIDHSTQNLDAKTAGQNIENQLASLNLDTQRKVQQAIIAKQNAEGSLSQGLLNALQILNNIFGGTNPLMQGGPGNRGMAPFTGHPPPQGPTSGPGSGAWGPL